MTRCRNPNSKDWRKYGGRGIAICERWLRYENFRDDMGPRPSKLHTVDRIDNDGNYEPGNCRWALPREQGNNRRTNIWMEHLGVKHTLAEWADIAGVNRITVYWRYRQGWRGEKLLSPPQTMPKL